MKMMMRSVPVFVFLGLLVFQVALAWPERRTFDEFPEQKRNDESKLMDELVSRLLDNKRGALKPACGKEKDFECWDVGCFVLIGKDIDVFIDYSPIGGLYVSLEYYKNDYDMEILIDEELKASDLSELLPYSKKFKYKRKVFTLTIQNIVLGGEDSDAVITGVCLE
ncbi:uncharacterized protein LOC119736502 [Patiria miniata]|uniref:Uncharacterized protein n=1 Tax=Patiria miniata TaxID=46514 RepID=A0A914APU3_PATMI|nr:uncharacterized protein LOC119735917 [Patiria miniata]XP_038066055.1 uncharacterized protein LOC119736084 [Patiria miniata]XP_038066476.1 uncharacterized protein LOC119736502 [Patiria miniata]